jgi:microcystin-dependent protein
MTNTTPSGGQAHENRMPYMPINYCIALTGIFPSRT